jgi:RHS repeat-associated protein
VIGLVLLFAFGALPWPLVIRPAGAQCDNPTPTPTPGPQIRHYHLDHLGSTQVITDGGGNIVEQIRYKPYGEVRGRWNGTGGAITAPDPDRRHEFTGYETEMLSGLEYAGARFYDPVLGTFLTHDPAREFANPYSYVGGDPVNIADPSGACIWDLCIAEAFIVGAVIGAAVSAIQAAANGAKGLDVLCPFGSDA